MLRLIRYLKEYLHIYYHKKLYLIVLIFLFVSILTEYSFQLKEIYSGNLKGHVELWFIMFLHHFYPYIFVCAVIYYLGINRKFVNENGFWIKCLVGFLILGLDQSDFYNAFLDKFLSGYSLFFYSRVWGWVNSIFIIVIPLILLNKLWEKGNSRNLYGLQFKQFDIRPYLILLLLTSFVLYAGSFWSDIHNYYPRYLHSYGTEMANGKNMPRWIPLFIYESAYSSNFISVELFFRGFLILAFTRYLGGYAVIPMVATYCFLHFGKPLGESISSIFGGYILGIISYNTRNIWGGIILHVGVALLMELFGYLQNIS